MDNDSTEETRRRRRPTSETKVEPEPSAHNLELLEGLKEESDLVKQRYRQLQTDWEAWRKRQGGLERASYQRGQHDVLRDFLSLLDDLKRAESHLPTGADADATRAGLELIFTGFKRTLSKLGIEEVSTSKFDPHLHEAVGTAASDKPSGEIVHVVQSGYQLHGTILRHAKVIVSE